MGAWQAILTFSCHFPDFLLWFPARNVCFEAIFHRIGFNARNRVLAFRKESPSSEKTIMGKKRVLSGMRPTGDLHIGNYFGAIKQFLDLQAAGEECFFFAADIHSLTEVEKPTEVGRLSVEVAKNYLACGIDPSLSTLYRQSDVPEVSEIALLLSNTVTIARLRRCTTFKERVQNRKKTEDEVSFGLLGYPVLMAADILCVRADCVPVGEDQVQHVEMTRDFARTFNHMFARDVFTIPELNVSNPLRVPGIDGKEKMGKSEGNAIALLDAPGVVDKKVRGIPTQTKMDGTMQSGTQALFTLMELCCPESVHTEYLRRFSNRESGFFGNMKRRIALDLTALLAPIQERYQSLSDDDVRDILAQGAKKVRSIAASVLSDMHTAMGL